MFCSYELSKPQPPPRAAHFVFVLAAMSSSIRNSQMHICNMVLFYWIYGMTLSDNEPEILYFYNVFLA